MTNFSGYSISGVGPSEQYPNAPDKITGFYTPDIKYAEISPAGNGVVSSNLPLVERRANFTGHQVEFYESVFYNRILIEPKLVDVGNLTTTQTRTINVFNAYLDSDVDLNAINAFNDEGVTITGPATPLTMSSLQEIEYEISVNIDGPTEINAKYQFDFIDFDDQEVDVIGSRIVTFPYYFKSGMSESLSWDTEIITTRLGVEQRIRKRGKPRQSFSTQVFLSRDELNRGDILVAGWRGRNWALPVWSESRKGDSVNAGDSSISVSTLNGDFRDGSLCIVWSSPRKFEVLESVTVTDDAIAFDRPLTKTFSSPVVAPVRIARMADDPTRNYNGATGQLSAVFDVVDNVLLSGGDQSYQYNGLDVFVTQPNLPASASYTNPIDIIDYGTSKTEQFNAWEYTKINTRFLVGIDSQEDAWNFRLFLHKVAGRAIGFYMPTFESNLRIISTGTIVTGFDIRDDDQLTQADYRNHIAFKIKDGSWFFAEVVDIQRVNDTTLTVGIDTALNIDASQIEFISYMGEKRLSSDSVSISWGPNNTGQSNIGVTEYQP